MTNTLSTHTEAVAQPDRKTRVPYPVRILLVCLLMFLNVFSVLLFYPVTLIPGFTEQSDTALEWWGQLMRLIPAGASIGLVWLMMRFVDRRPLRETGLRFTRWSVPLWLLGIAGGIVAVLPASVWLTSAGLLRPETDYYAGSTPFMTLVGVVVLGLFMQGFPEELLWRGYALQTMRGRSVLAVLVSALVFGAMHWFSGAGQTNAAEHLIYCFAASGLGILAGALAVATRSVWSAVGVHFGLHLAYYFNSLLDAGTGPLLWAAEGVVFWALAAIVYLTGKRAFAPPITLER